MPLSITRVGSLAGAMRRAIASWGRAILVCLVGWNTLVADDQPARLPRVNDLTRLPPANSTAWTSQLRGPDCCPAQDPIYADPTLPLEPPQQLEGEPWDWSGMVPEEPWLSEPDFRSRLPLGAEIPPGAGWQWQVMPRGLLFQSYLAGAKEPRFSSYWNRDSELGNMWDASMGGRLGLLRYGSWGPEDAEGWQLDLEGACQTRLDPWEDSNPLYSVDFRAGIPVTWARGSWQFKTGYYHISAHLGDEYMVLNPTAKRINYTRDAALLAVGYFWTERLRLYGETAYAIGVSGGAEPWEFQWGADYAPARYTGLRGAPYAALNAHVREELDFGGNLVLQTGWCWRQYRGSLFRVGVQYYRGKSDQYEYYNRSEDRFGWGLWADF